MKIAKSIVLGLTLLASTMYPNCLYDKVPKEKPKIESSWTKKIYKDGCYVQGTTTRDGEEEIFEKCKNIGWNDPEKCLDQAKIYDSKCKAWMSTDVIREGTDYKILKPNCKGKEFGFKEIRGRIGDENPLETVCRTVGWKDTDINFCKKNSYKFLEKCQVWTRISCYNNVYEGTLLAVPIPKVQQ